MKLTDAIFYESNNSSNIFETKPVETIQTSQKTLAPVEKLIISLLIFDKADDGSWPKSRRVGKDDLKKTAIQHITY